MSARRFFLRVTVVMGAVMVVWCASAFASLKHPYISSFGSFTNVQGVAIDQSTGDVYVLDTGAGGGSLLKFDAAGNPLKFTGVPGEPLAITSLGYEGEGEKEIAVDNSNGPAKGDVYVAVSGANNDRVDVFAPDGASLGALSESTAPWGETCGVAVDDAGNVYVGIYAGFVDKFAPKGNPPTNADYVSSIGGVVEPCNLAVDSMGDVFAVKWPSGPVTRYAPSQFGSLSPMGSIVDPGGTTLAVDGADDHVYVDERGGVSEFGANGEPFAEPVSVFGERGEGAVSGSEGIAVNETTGNVYVSSGQGKLNVFGPGVVLPTPNAVTGHASNLAGHGATLEGSVNPNGAAITDCHFEYGPTVSYGESVPCSSNPGNGSQPVSVKAAIAGLQSDATYYFRLVAINSGGEDTGYDEAFTTVQTVTINGATNVTSEGATLNGSVDPEGETVTSCQFEYGLSDSYGQSVPCAAGPGTGSTPVAVSAAISNLLPKGTYHFRLMVTDATGTDVSVDRVLTTEGPLSAGVEGLPDGRAYEMVSPPNNGDAEIYEPYIPVGGSLSQLYTQGPFQASADGDAIVYLGSPTVGGNEDAGYDAGNQYLSRRSGDGDWAQTNLAPAGFPSAVFQGFSSNLSEGFLDSLEGMVPQALGFGASNPLGGNYDVLYTTETATGGYTPLFTTTPPYRSRLEFESYKVGHPDFGQSTRTYNNRILAYAGASADSTHVLFEANDALTPDAEGGSARHYEEENNLYESIDGRLRLVNVLPDGSTKANATFGALNPEVDNGRSADSDFSHVISDDGSRIFWTDLNTGHIYMREDGTRTVEISPAGRYWTATADGSKVFYTNGDLYEYDVESERTTDLTPGVSVEGVIGAGEDGEYVYYVTSDYELDLWHAGETRTIKKLTAADNENVYGGSEFGGDWKPGLGDRTAEVAPDGKSVVFVSTSGKSGDFAGTIEVYDADDNHLYCASCGTDGSKGVLPSSFSDTYMKRWLSEDGDRVFFDSWESLVSQDTNGELDAYEWERPGVGSCDSSEGCIYLLSGGTSSDSSYFADAGASGGDAFIVTRAKLLQKDENEFYDLYDARVNGFVAPSSPACTGTGCQGLPGAPPIFATPSSVTFEGVGNFAATGEVVKIKKKSEKKKPKKRKSKKKTKRKKPSQKKSKHGKANSAKIGRRGGRVRDAAPSPMRSSGKGGRS